MPQSQKSKHTWRLRLSQNPQWQAQYTGFDPELRLPDALTEERALAFLIAQARFADARLAHIKPLAKLREYCHVFTQDVPEPLRKRVYHYTSVTEVKDPMIEWLSNYMHSGTDKKFGAGIHFDVRNPYESFVEDFRDKMRVSKGKLSARGFLDFLAVTTKLEYVEAWLLYPGQTIDELVSFAKSHRAMPAEHKAVIEKLAAAYNDSGLATCVKQMRDLASSPEAQAENRIKVKKDFGPPYGMIQVGALDSNQSKY